MDGIHCRESAGTGPVLIIVVPVTGAAFSGTVLPWTNQCAPPFSHVLYLYVVDMCDTESIRDDCTVLDRLSGIVKLVVAFFPSQV